MILKQLSAIIFCVLLISNSVIAQDDAVYRFRADGGNTKISGKITGTTPFGVNVNSNSGLQEIPAAEINKVIYSGEPLEIGRARDRLEAGRFDDVMVELDKISEPIKSPEVQAEIDYLIAAATAESSLRLGTSTAQEAGQAMIKFLKSNPNSHHFYPCTELLGKLYLAIGRPELAESEFVKLTESKWPELVLRGYFYRGEVLNEMDKPAEAATSYQAIQSIQSNDDLTQTYRQLAKVRLAKSQALQGQAEEAIKAIEEVIKVENPDNERLFAYAYNSLGTAQMKAGNTKAAATAFLHTDLLYSKELEAHAEALYQLALLWPQLDQTDRASRARDTLKSRYRNSYWTTKL